MKIPQPTAGPQPRVPSFPISAPAVAKDPAGIVPVRVEDKMKEGFWEETLDAAPKFLPGRTDEALFAATKLINKIISRSPGKPGAPIPATPGSWKFAAIGDYGSGKKALTDVTNNISRGKPDMVITMGDNVYYNGTDAEYKKKWDPPQAFGSIRENFPVFPSLGNHDARVSTEPYFARFPELDHARFYSFNHNNVHFVSVNSTESLAPGSPQRAWIEKDLAASKEQFKVMYLHHPLFTSYPKNNGANQGYLAPIVAKYGVELVLSGHEHNYSRMKPINDEGSIEIISGGGGQTIHPFFGKQPDFVAYRDVDFGHLEFEVDDNKMIGRYIVRDGSVRDSFEVPDIVIGDHSGADAIAAAAAVDQTPAAVDQASAATGADQTPVAAGAPTA